MSWIYHQWCLAQQFGIAIALGVISVLVTAVLITIVMDYLAEKWKRFYAWYNGSHYAQRACHPYGCGCVMCETEDERDHYE